MVIWESMQQVAAAGNSKTVSDYTVFDLYPFTGESYYRLMQTGLDGKQTYSAIRSVSLENAASAISIYPNPASDFIRITFPSVGQFEVTILNSEGQVMINPVQTENINLVLNVSNLEPGFYFLRVSQKTVSEIRKIIIRR